VVLKVREEEDKVTEGEEGMRIIRVEVPERKGIRGQGENLSWGARDMGRNLRCLVLFWKTGLNRR
jgi:hypothetical protein